MGTLSQDLRYALRMLAKNPGFTLVAVLTLALGIGANTAIFSVVYGVILRPLPYPQPDRLVQLAETYHVEFDEMDVSYPGFQFLRDRCQAFERFAGYGVVGFNLAAAGEAERVRGLHVSADYFRALAVEPVLGRDFLSEEDLGDGQRVAILSDGLWKRRFGADRSVIGRTILLDGQPFTLIGVMPPEFASLGAVPPGFDASFSVDVWVPLALAAKTIGQGENLGVIARLKLGITLRQAQSQTQGVFEEYRRQFLQDAPPHSGITFLPYRQVISADVRTYLIILLGAISFVLLIACANVANLMLSRSAARGREVAVRTALGATRFRLVRQLLTESVLIALAGGALGLLLASWGLDSLLALTPANLPRAAEIHLDRWVFLFTFLISVLTGLLFGLAPALQATRTNISEALKEGAGRATAGVRHGRLRNVLAIGEVALSLVLLTGAGLLIGTFANLLRTDPGFNPHHILALQFWLTGSKHNSTAETANYYRAVVQRVEALPGVQAAGVISAGSPLERGGNIGMRIVAGQSSQPIGANYRSITPGCFRALATPLEQGRFFTEADSETSNQVAIINELFARRYFADRSPLGQHIWISSVLREIVGVVGNVKSYVDQPVPPTAFVPAAQAPYSTTRLFESWFPTSLVVRTSIAPLSLSQAVRQAVQGVDPMVALGPVRSMDQVLSKSLALQQFMMVLLGTFAGLALILAAVGIYSVISYSVTQRTHEIGVRMALGARPEDVQRLILGQGLRIILIGAVIGVAAALALTQFLASLLYGVTATDAKTFVLVVAVLAFVALAACYIPARRAMRVDPMVALRYE